MGFHAKIVIAYDANHRAWNNFDINKVNVSFYAYHYQNSTNDWRDSVSMWRTKNIKQDKQRYILQRIHNQKGFEYLSLSKNLFNPLIDCEQEKKKMNIRINIKLDKYAGIEAFDYKQNIQIDENLSFEQQPFKLKNFLFRECTVDLIGIDDDIQHCINLKPRDDKEIFIPIHVALNETVNKAIANKLKFKHKMCRIQQFASKIVYKLLNLEKQKKEKHHQRNRYFAHGRWNYYDLKKPETILYKVTEKWKYDNCHNPNCNLLPLTCDLNRILTDYMPYYDVLKDILIPYIGYSVVYYVQMEAKNIKYYAFDTYVDEETDEFFHDFVDFDKPEIISNDTKKNQASFDDFDDIDPFDDFRKEIIENMFGEISD